MPQSNIKVLFLGNYLSAHRGTIGPTEILAKHFQSHGISAKIASSQEAKLFRAADLLFETLTTRSQVICADVFSGNILTILPLVSQISTWRKKKLVLVLRGGQLPEIFAKNAGAISKIFYRANVLLTPSLFLKQFFEMQGFKLEYLPNPVQLERFKYSPARLQSPAKLLWIRAFAEIYHPELAVDTLFELRRSHPDATLTMIGPNAGTLGVIRAHIAEKGLEDAVQILGPLAHEKLGEHYRSHTVFLNTTAYESFGNAVLEAAACGIPIVSTRVGNIPLLWQNGRDILLAQEPEAADFAAQIRRILTNPAFAKQLSENARKKAEQFDIQLTLPKWRALFNQLTYC